MVQFSPECPLETLIRNDPERYQKGLGSGVFLQVVQGLSGQMEQLVPGTNGLTPAKIEEILQEEIEDWGNPDDTEGEAGYLRDHPELATAAHDCELRIQAGLCALHSMKVKVWD